MRALLGCARVSECPAVVEGSVVRRCERCGEEVYVSPSAFKIPVPLEIVCLEHALEEVDAGAEVAPLTEDQVGELLQAMRRPRAKA